MFGRATITLGIGPHFSLDIMFSICVSINVHVEECLKDVLSKNLYLHLNA